MLGLLDPTQLIETGSYVLLFAIVFVETGLLVGFFLPGDSLLFTAGVFASKGDLRLSVVLVGCTIAAILGDQLGYTIGRRVGPALERRPDGRLFKQAHLHRAQDFFERHGPRTIVLARFVPIVRTFAPVLAGVGKMDRRKFTTYNVVGGIAWAVGVTLLGFFAGEVIGAETVDKFLLPIIGVIVLASLAPVVIEHLRHRRADATPAEPIDGLQAEPLLVPDDDVR